MKLSICALAMAACLQAGVVSPACTTPVTVQPQGTISCENAKELLSQLSDCYGGCEEVKDILEKNLTGCDLQYVQELVKRLCNKAPVTPTEAPKPTATVVPTKAPTATVAPTKVPTATVAPTEAPKPTATVAPTEVPKPTATVAPTKVPTATVAPTEASKPTATVAPTEAPKPTATVAPTKAPAATVAPTEAPKPTATVAPTEAPKPTATVAPTEAPKPTATVAPTVTATPTVTVAPTATATPTKAPTATATPTSVPKPTVTPTPTKVPTQEETNNIAYTYGLRITELVNEHRVAAGLQPVEYSTVLSAPAQVRAKEIQQSFAHTRPDGRYFSSVLKDFGIPYRTCGENIAWGQRSPEEVVNAWMNSPGHRANILSANYTKLGVGYDKNGNVNYFTQLFTN